MAHRNDSVLYEYQGERRTVTAIARMAGMRPITLYMRLKRGRSLEQALADPVRRRWSSR